MDCVKTRPRGELRASWLGGLFLGLSLLQTKQLIDFFGESQILKILDLWTPFTLLSLSSIAFYIICQDLVNSNN